MLSLSFGVDLDADESGQVLRHVRVLLMAARLADAVRAVDVVAGVDQGERGGLENVDRHADAVEDAALVPHVDVDLAECVHACAVGGDREAREFAADAGEARDAVVDRVDGTVADRGVAAGALADAQANGGGRDRVRAARHHAQGIELERVLLLFERGAEEERLEVVVKDLALLVGKLQEARVDFVQIVFIVLVAHVGERGADHVAARARRHAHRVAREAHALGREDLVGLAVLEDAVLMNARRVREGVGAHDRLVRGHGLAADFGDEARGAGDLLRVDARVETAERLLAQLDRHGDLLERAVARTLAQTVHAALDLERAVLNGGDRVGRGHAEVVVAVG